MSKVAGTYTRARPTGEVIDITWEVSTTHVIEYADGRVIPAMNMIIPEDKFPMLKQGYMCAQCGEALDMAFPENCPVCNFPMREKQTEFIAEMYVGNVKMGPSTTLADERLIMQEMREKEARKLGIWTPKSRWI